MGIFALTAMLAGNAVAADEVVVYSGSEHKKFAAGKHEFSGTITSANVPMRMGMVVYDENDKALAVFSFQNSGLEPKIENVASIEVVDRFPSKAEVEAMLKMCGLMSGKRARDLAKRRTIPLSGWAFSSSRNELPVIGITSRRGEAPEVPDQGKLR